ncbi:uncharacterized protein MEPE_06603 [Melanopsichium pennsylvanicum]|uniref:Uncharacterized protein n=1 Tax=Melanopsichium pennsylvanicum TaxID=63383 RepID=A0AAJ4XT02_9BASI|nr:uncharacterized protein MEPE_06603 [Melanopsichium pennsylvanicum]
MGLRTEEMQKKAWRNLLRRPGNDTADAVASVADIKARTLATWDETCERNGGISLNGNDADMAELAQ